MVSHQRRSLGLLLVVLVAALLTALGWLANSPPSVAGQAPPTPLPFSASLPLVASDGVNVPSNSFTIYFLDVGQGDAIVITVNGHRMLVDGGPSRDRLRNRLQSLGVND